MAREVEEDEGDPNAWMATFADLVTLLITFFVLLLSMSSLDAKSLDETFGFFNGRLGALNTAQGPISRRNIVQPPEPPVLAHVGMTRYIGPKGKEAFDNKETIVPADAPDIPSPTLSRDVQSALAELSGTLEGSDVDSLLSSGSGTGRREDFETVMRLLDKPRFSSIFLVERREDTLRISMASELLFLPGRVRIRRESLVLLREVASFLRRLRTPVRVLGVVPEKGSSPAMRPDFYPTGWELAIARSSNVVRYLHKTLGVSGENLSCAVLPPGAGFGKQVQSDVVFELEVPERNF